VRPQRLRRSLNPLSATHCLIDLDRDAVAVDAGRTGCGVGLGAIIKIDSVAERLRRAARKPKTLWLRSGRASCRSWAEAHQSVPVTAFAFDVPSERRQRHSSAAVGQRNDHEPADGDDL